MTDQTEITWRGERIVQIDYKPIQPFSRDDAYGFTMQQAFVVRDDMDEPCLPISQQYFWSPAEAIAAIYMRDFIAPEVTGKRWPTTVMYEYNQMTLYRRNFHQVYHVLQQIKKVLADAKEWDENPTDKIRDMLNLLHQNCYETSARSALDKADKPGAKK